DNWATCDQLSPKVFSRHRDALLPHIRQWLHSLHPYTVRFAIKMLMDHFLGDAISPEYPKWWPTCNVTTII
ncbi:MAG: DNA alkylation repair protein, partial [Lachnospiraceae bacterium]|nr:DNA alkylation repair protein [Lachnospiraceae bacterium]